MDAEEELVRKEKGEGRKDGEMKNRGSNIQRFSKCGFLREKDRARTEDAGWGKLLLKIRELSPELRNTGNENFYLMRNIFIFYNKYFYKTKPVFRNYH